MTIKERILDIVCQYIEVEADKIDTAEPLKYAEGLNSFVLMSMISNIEEEFGIAIPNDTLMDFKTLDDVIDFVEKAQ